MSVSRLALAAAPFFTLVMGAEAADPSYPSPPAEVAVAVPGGWSIIVAPYLWAVGLGGTVGVGGRTAEIDESFGEILADFDIGYMGVTEVRYDRFALFSDLTYGKLSSSDKTPSASSPARETLVPVLVPLGTQEEARDDRNSDSHRRHRRRDTLALA